MSSRKFNVHLELLIESSILAPSTGFVSLGALVDGLYINTGSVQYKVYSTNDIVAVLNGGTGKNSVANNSMLYASASNVYSEVTTSSFGRGLLNAVSGTIVSGLNADKVDGYNFNQSLQTTDNVTHANITATGIMTLTSTSAGAGYWTTYVANGRTSLGALNSANGYGLFYYQGSAGRDGADSVDISFNATTSALSNVSFKQNGDVKIAGNVIAGGNVTAPTFIGTIAPSYISGGYTASSNTYVNTHPENSGWLFPFINNDIAFLTLKGGTISSYTTSASDFTQKTLTNTGTVTIAGQTNMFDGSPSYATFSVAATTTQVIIDITCPVTYGYGTQIYIDFGNSGWRAQNVAFYCYNNNINNSETVYKLFGSVTNSSIGEFMVNSSYSYTNTSSGTSYGFNQLRVVLTNFMGTLNPRIACIGVVNYGSAGLKETFISRGGSSIYGDFYPITDATINLGESGNRWAGIYGATVYASTLDLSASGGAFTMHASQINRTDGYIEMQFAGGNGVRMFGNTAYPVIFYGNGSISTLGSITAPTFVGALTGHASLDAPLASPTFTGTPLSTTAAVNTNTTQIATTAFVLGQVGTASPTMNGSVLVGTSYLYSRQDHVHPVDTSRQAALTNPITGTGTINYLSKFNATGSITNSIIYDNGTNVLIGTTSDNGTDKLQVNGSAIFKSNSGVFNCIELDSVDAGTLQPVDIKLGSTNPKGIRIYTSTTPLTVSPSGAGFQMYSNAASLPGQMYFDSGAINTAFIAFRTAITSGNITERMRITSVGNIVINGVDNGSKLQVTGSTTLTGQVLVTGLSNNLQLFTPSDDVAGTMLYGTNAAGSIVKWQINKDGSFVGNGATFASNVSVTGVANITSSTSNAITLTTPINIYNLIALYSGSTTRWQFGKDQTTESGSNIGANFSIYSYTDTGGYLNQNLIIYRSTGSAVFSNTVTATQFIGSGAGLTTGTIPIASLAATPWTSYLPLSGGTLTGNLTAGSYTMTASNFILSSDKRLKTKIKDLDHRYLDLKFKEYELKSNPGDKRYGVIAQDLLKIAPEFVTKDSNGMYAVKYVDLLVAKVAELEMRIQILEGRS